MRHCASERDEIRLFHSMDLFAFGEYFIAGTFVSCAWKANSRGLIVPPMINGSAGWDLLHRRHAFFMPDAVEQRHEQRSLYLAATFHPQ